MLPDRRDEAGMRAAFRWQVPEFYNMAEAVCDRWAAIDPARLALLEISASGTVTPVSYGALRDRSNRLANVLSRKGVQRGDRVAILLPQSREVAEAHIALYKLGAIAVPLAVLFGIDALAYRLADHQRVRLGETGGNSSCFTFSRPHSLDRRAGSFRARL